MSEAERAARGPSGDSPYTADHGAGLAFLAGGGAMSELIGAHDWSTTPLGPPVTWPLSLRTVVSLMLRAKQPMYIAWGPHKTSLYNDGYVAICGEKHPAALGQPFDELWAEVWDDLRPMVEATLAGQAQWVEDMPMALAGRGSAGPSWFSFSWTPLLDDDGEVAGLLSVATETTEKVRSEQRLAVQRDRFAQLFEQAPTFMAMLLGPEHRIEMANPGFMRLVGHREVIGKTVAEALPDAVAQGYLVLLDQVYRSGKAFAANGSKYAMQATPGGPIRERFVDFVYQPITDNDGAVSAIFVEGADVTERTLSEMARRDTEARLRDLNAELERKVIERTHERGLTWQVSPDLLSVINVEGFFESTNPAWQALLGWSEDELRKTRFDGFLHPDDAVRTEAAFDHATRGHPVLRFENRYRRKDGEYRWLSWVAVPQDGKLYCSARDVTGEKEQAAALDEAHEALRQSQKMEAVGQLTGGLAHDFNNLLTGIGGSLELLQIRLAQGRMQDLDHYVNAAQGAAKRAAALTHRLLAFSRRQTLEPKPTNLNRLVAGMEDLIRRTVGPQITVEPVAAGGLWTTLVDPNQLENALLNLCINARDAMPDGGRLTIETGNRWLDDRPARERDVAPGQYVSLCVSDNGLGMSPDVIARAFDPFFTTKPIGMGTGLGLSMIYGFAKQSGGQVRIYSEVGEGTMVCLYLPRHDGDAEGSSATDAALLAPRAEQGETVLVIDDEPTVRMLVTEVLSDLGYAAIEAGDGAAGLRVLQSDVRIDLLITDVGLPGGMNGQQVADAARLIRPGLKVLFITGYAENAVFSHGHLNPGMQVLTKPFSMDALAGRIKRLIADL